MKKISIVMFVALILQLLGAVSVSAATYTDGAVIFEENFNSKQTSDLNYDVLLRNRYYNTTEDPSQIALSVVNGKLHIKNNSASALYFIELVKEELISGVDKWTIQYDISAVAIDTSGGFFGVGFFTPKTSTEAGASNAYHSIQLRSTATSDAGYFINQLRNTTGWLGGAIAPVVLTNKGLSAGYNVNHTIKVEVDGDEVSAYVDDTLISIVDTDPCDCAIFLLAYKAGEAYFDNIKVWAGVGIDPVSGSDTTAVGTTTAAGTTAPNTFDGTIIFILTALAALCVTIPAYKISRIRRSK